MAAKSQLLIKAEAGREKLNWKWLNGEQEVTTTQLGNPGVDTDYALCIYIGTALTEINIPTGSRWRQAGSSIKYKDRNGMPDGVKQVLVKAAPAGKPKALVKAKGVNVPLPAFAAMGLSPPVTVQLTNSDERCWQAVYDTTAVIKNEENEFKAKSESTPL